MANRLTRASLRAGWLQYRRGTASEWAAINPVLKTGEPGYEEGTGKFKIGDGSTAWTGLPYQISQIAYRGDYSAQAEYVDGDIVIFNQVGYVLDNHGDTIPEPGTGDGSPVDGAEYAAAAGQPTDFGKTISALARVDGTVLLGYGDYDANNGPVDIGQVTSADPDAAPTSVSEGFASEQVALLRVLSDGRVFVPAVDPTGTVGGHLAIRAVNGMWTQNANRISDSALHIFDLIEGPGGVLFACGSAYETGSSGDSGAVIWRSEDDGATWTVDYSIFGSNPGESNRFYWLAAAGDAVYAANHETDEAGEEQVKLRWTAADGWEEFEHVLPVNLGPGKPWRDGYVMPGGHWGYSNMRGALRYFDGDTVTTLDAAAAGFDVGDDGALYYLTVDGALRRITADGPLAPETLANLTVDDDILGLAVLPGEQVFVSGGSDAHLRIYNLAERDPWHPIAADVIDPETEQIREELLPLAAPAVGSVLVLGGDEIQLGAGWSEVFEGTSDIMKVGPLLYVSGLVECLAANVYNGPVFTTPDYELGSIQSGLFTCYLLNNTAGFVLRAQGPGRVYGFTAGDPGTEGIYWDGPFTPWITGAGAISADPESLAQAGDKLRLAVSAVLTVRA